MLIQMTKTLKFRMGDGAGLSTPLLLVNGNKIDTTNTNHVPEEFREQVEKHARKDGNGMTVLADPKPEPKRAASNAKGKKSEGSNTPAAPGTNESQQGTEGELTLTPRRTPS